MSDETTRAETIRRLTKSIKEAKTQFDALETKKKVGLGALAGVVLGAMLSDPLEAVLTGVAALVGYKFLKEDNPSKDKTDE